jgi:hypothetical protein
LNDAVHRTIVEGCRAVVIGIAQEARKAAMQPQIDRARQADADLRTGQAMDAAYEQRIADQAARRRARNMP